MKKDWLKKLEAWVAKNEESVDRFGSVIVVPLVLGIIFLLIKFVGFIYSISYIWGYIVMFGGIGCPLYFFTRKRWIFWLYLSIVVVVFFFVLSAQ